MWSSVAQCYDLFRGGGPVMLGLCPIPHGEVVLADNVVVIEGGGGCDVE